MTTFFAGSANPSLRYADYAEGRIVNVEFDGDATAESAALLWFEGYDRPVRKPARWIPDFDVDDESYYVAAWQPQITRDTTGHVIPRRRFVFLRLGDYEDVAAQVSAES